MDRCPNCQARYKGVAQCQRCNMDLSWLLEIEARAQALAMSAIGQFAEDDLKGAERSLAKAVHLHRTPGEQRLLGFVRFLRAMTRR
ncbi:MAG: hypothetical protein ACREX9_22220 [Gammaproteobacteria bacterium]